MIVFTHAWVLYLPGIRNERNPQMTAYAIVTLTIEDQAALENYRAQAGPALAKHKATPLSVSSEAQVIEGEGPAPDVTVLLQFPDRDHALAWISDTEIEHVHAARRASGASRIILM
jgi:uncharacterized protein (DUF1330 family)